MIGWPKSLAARLVAAAAGSLGAIVALNVWLQQSEAAPRTTTASLGPASAPQPLGLGFVLAPCDGPILLVSRPSSIGPDVAPVVQILADGSLVLRRAAALPQGPGGPSPVPTKPANAVASAVVPAGVPGAAIVLPEPSLARLSASARGALVELIAQLVAVRPVGRARCQVVDFSLPAGELAALLGWVP